MFLRADFKTFGSPTHVGRALTKLLSEGALVKIGIGVYARSKVSPLSGKPIPIKPIEVLAPEVLRMLGVHVGESRQTREYNSGATTQVPVGIVYNVGKRRIKRKIGFNNKFVRYENE